MEEPFIHFVYLFLCSHLPTHTPRKRRLKVDVRLGGLFASLLRKLPVRQEF